MFINVFVLCLNVFIYNCIYFVLAIFGPSQRILIIIKDINNNNNLVTIYD